MNTPMHLRALMFGVLLVWGHNVAHSQGYDSQRFQDLLTLANSDAASERVDAAKGLGLSVYPKAATDTLLVLLKDKQWFVRGTAADSLKSRGYQSAVSALTNAVQSETNENVRERMSSAIEALKSSSGYFIDGFTDTDPRVREKTAVNAAYRHDSGVANALISLLNDPDSAVQSAAATSLVQQQNPAVVPYEIRILESSSDVIARTRAAQSLGDLHAHEAVDPLIRALSDPSRLIWPTAVVALGEIGDPRAAQPIVATLPTLTDSDWYSSTLALSKLGESGLTALIGALDNNNEYVRSVPARGLSLFKDSRATSALIRTLNDQSDAVRGYAAISLADIGDRAAIQPLLNTLKQRTGRSNESVAAALGRFQDRRAVPAFLFELRNFISTYESNAIIKALGEVGGNDSLTALSQILQGQFASKYTFVDLDRQYAAESIATIGGDHANSILYDALRKQDLPAIQGAARYFIATGRDGSEYSLAKALDPQNQWLRGLAEYYLASGQPALVDAANAWAAAQHVQLFPALYKPVKWKQGMLTN